jgi:hypothetical protein
VQASATPRSAPSVVSAHQAVVASFEAGRTTRAMTSANARSRDRPAGPNIAGKPNDFAAACTAATCPCGSERVTSSPSPATTSVWPANDARTASTVASGSAERFAGVSCLTLVPSR